jgi:sugar phosphate isomerase/epimerase
VSTPISRRATLLTPLLLLAPRDAATRAGAMTLCMHTNTSSGAGYRGALEGWAKAGIRFVEINAGLVDEFLKTDTIDGARRVLTDNGLTAVHGTVGQFGLIEPNDKHAAAIDTLKKRLEMFSALGVKKVYTTTIGGQKLALDDYSKIADQIRVVGETAKAFDTIFNVEFVRASQYMSTLLTTLKVMRQAAHPNVGVMFDFYHFWSGNNKLEDMDQVRPGDIQHVNFQDVPDLPRELLDNNTRVIPGDGVAPIGPMLKKLAEKGYAGPLSVELFLPQFRDGSPYEVAREIKQKCEAVMARAGVA